MSTTIGYLRVSTEGQDLEKNKTDILKLANHKELGNVKWVQEKISGTKDWRGRKLGGAIESLQKGDTLIVSELSRLGRSTLQILEIIGIAKKKEINVHAVKGGWSLDDSMNGKIVLHMLAMCSEIERDLISERTKEGLRAVRARGVKLGRPKGKGKSRLDEYEVEITALLNNGSSKTFVAKRYGTTTANLYNWLKKNKAALNPL